jgi:hypothetical protein
MLKMMIEEREESSELREELTRVGGETDRGHDGGGRGSGGGDGGE